MIRSGAILGLGAVFHGVPSGLPTSIAFTTASLLVRRSGPDDGNGKRLWSDACDFYRQQLRRSIEAQSYLRSRGMESPAVVDRMRIGYAPGGCLRACKIRVI